LAVWLQPETQINVHILYNTCVDSGNIDHRFAILKTWEGAKDETSLLNGSSFIRSLVESASVVVQFVALLEMTQYNNLNITSEPQNFQAAVSPVTTITTVNSVASVKADFLVKIGRRMHVEDIVDKKTEEMISQKVFASACDCYLRNMKVKTFAHVFSAGIGYRTDMIICNKPALIDASRHTLCKDF